MAGLPSLIEFEAFDVLEAPLLLLLLLSVDREGGVRVRWGDAGVGICFEVLP